MNKLNRAAQVHFGLMATLLIPSCVLSAPTPYRDLDWTAADLDGRLADFSVTSSGRGQLARIIFSKGKLHGRPKVGVFRPGSQSSTPVAEAHAAPHGGWTFVPPTGVYTSRTGRHSPIIVSVLRNPDIAAAGIQLRVWSWDGVSLRPLFSCPPGVRIPSNASVTDMDADGDPELMTVYADAPPQVFASRQGTFTTVSMKYPAIYSECGASADSLIANLHDLLSSQSDQSLSMLAYSVQCLARQGLYSSAVIAAERILEYLWRNLPMAQDASRSRHLAWISRIARARAQAYLYEGKWVEANRDYETAVRAGQLHSLSEAEYVHYTNSLPPGERHLVLADVNENARIRRLVWDRVSVRPISREELGRARQAAGDDLADVLDWHGATKYYREALSMLESKRERATLELKVREIEVLLSGNDK